MYGRPVRVIGFVSFEAVDEEQTGPAYGQAKAGGMSE